MSSFQTLDKILNCSLSCLVVVVVHFMSADNQTLPSPKGDCMAMAALCVPFYDLVIGKIKSMRECSSSSSIIICTIHILGRYLLVSDAFRLLCSTILSTAICSSVFVVSSTVTFSPPGAGKHLFRRDPIGIKETES